MKTKLFCFLVLLIAFSGCDKIKDAATITIPTNLTTNISVVVPIAGAMKSFDLVATDNSFLFSKTDSLVLTGNDDLALYLDKVKAIDLNTVVVTISGLSAGQTINSIKLNVNGVGDIFAQTNITSSTNNSFTLMIDSVVLNQVAAQLTDKRKITLTVSGSASGAISFTVGLNIGANVIAYVLK